MTQGDNDILFPEIRSCSPVAGQQETEKVVLRNRTKQLYSQEHDRKVHCTGSKGSPLEAQLHLSSGKLPFLNRLVLMNFWDLQSDQVWFTQDNRDCS